MSVSVRTAAAISRMWVRVYTARLPEAMREARRTEVAADLWEHEQDQRAGGTPTAMTAMEIMLRTCFGVLDDIAWRFEVLQETRQRSGAGRISMLSFTSRQTRWMGLAGLAGGLLWAINLVSLTLRDRTQYPAGAWDHVVPVVAAGLLLAGLLAFLGSYRNKLGRKGSIGVALLIGSMASYFLANTVLGLLPAGAVRSIIGVVVAAGFAIAPIPGFILVGLALEGRARAAAFLVAIAGPAGMLLPMILAQFGIVDPQWLRGNSPVNLTFFIYFFLAAAWLAGAGYSTYRQAARGV